MNNDSFVFGRFFVVIISFFVLSLFSEAFVGRFRDNFSGIWFRFIRWIRGLNI